MTTDIDDSLEGNHKLYDYIYNVDGARRNVVIRERGWK